MNTPTEPHQQVLRPFNAPPHESVKRAEANASAWAICTFIAAGVIAIFVLWGSRHPLTGVNSLGHVAYILGAIGAAISFVAARLTALRNPDEQWREQLPVAKRIIDLIALAVSIAALSGLAIDSAAKVFSLSFVGLDVDAIGGAALVGGATAIVSYAAGVFGARVSTVGLASLATLVLAVGTVAAMLTTTDPSWWELHFSQLGNLDGRSGFAFNASLVLAGLVIAVFANYAGRELEIGLRARNATKRDGSPINVDARVATLTWLVIVIGVMMMVVGIVHDAVNTAVHVGAASGMVVTFGVLAVFSMWWIPGIPNSYRVLTIAVMGGILVAIPLWIPFFYYNLTGVEVVCAALLFSWFVVFARTLTTYATVAPAQALVE